jgi:hypothetical protein
MKSALVAACALGCFLSGCCSKAITILTCNGKDMAVLSEKHAFPLYTTELDMEVQASVKTKAEVIEASLGGSLDEEVRMMYEQLDQINAQFRTHVASAYSAYLTEMCGAETAEERGRASERWNAQLAEASRYAAELRKVNIQAGQVLGSSSSATLERLVRVGNDAAAVGIEQLQPNR